MKAVIGRKTKKREFPFHCFAVFFIQMAFPMLRMVKHDNALYTRIVEKEK